uniref:Inositol polyphosphate multikinase n=1 Tax=Homo sapiens TaxID=9606 RepID=UPI000CE68203|nr:Chain A, Inositol polyphosphate multikinase [Homo sapiens]6E7F_B Chain B, Inositol polyphosphate multikinase [Homo sapiens]
MHHHHHHENLYFQGMDGTVLKQLQPPPRGPRELEFYNMVYAADCFDGVLLELRKYLPKYYGIWSPPTAPNDLYLKLEDVTHKFNKPCIMDVKIGQKSYDPFASSEKIQQQVSKYPLMEEIGFLVLGMRVYHVHSDSYETENQHYGRSLTKETIKDGVSRFFHNGYCLRKDAVAASIQKIEKILQWFENQKQLNFYASSLLFVYEGSSQPTTTKLNDRTLAEKFLSGGGGSGGGGSQEIAEVEVRMIDFAHVFPSNTIDEGYVYGLKHLISVLRSILDN